MLDFICPVCGSSLSGDTVLGCENGHSFDVSSSGYVNLLMNKSTDKTGDDAEMSRARRDFLSRGLYSPLADAASKAVCSVLEKRAGNGTERAVIDAGCGCGYYASRIYDAALTLGPLTLFAFDLSKTALKSAGKRCAGQKGVKLALANVFSLPVQSHAADCVISIFAPVADAEFCRVLKSGGALITVSPAEDHLFELKSFLYDKPYRNECVQKAYPDFEAVSRERVTFTMTLDRASASELFAMTPYTYKTSKDDAERLSRLQSLDTAADFYITKYIKKQ